jgi:Holliday junction resolvase RusA-like endonuclease
MKKIGEFTVICDPLFDQPMGYTRTTQAGKWSDKYQQYQQWKSHVLKSFIRDCCDLRVPIKTKCRLDVMIYFRFHRRSDPDNVFKGIADALCPGGKYGQEMGLCENDKYFIGEFDFEIDKESPRVEVEIYT